MVVLNKIRGSTLVETLVATVLIMVIFVVASLVINSAFLNILRANVIPVESRLHELEYQYSNSLFPLPYMEDYENWQITVQKEIRNDIGFIQFMAIRKTGGKIIKETRLFEN